MPETKSIADRVASIITGIQNGEMVDQTEAEGINEMFEHIFDFLGTEAEAINTDGDAVRQATAALKSHVEDIINDITI